LPYSSSSGGPRYNARKRRAQRHLTNIHAMRVSESDSYALLLLCPSVRLAHSGIVLYQMNMSLQNTQSHFLDFEKNNLKTYSRTSRASEAML